jgi:glycosyltransferase involved in cell wall biosynthesis
MVSGSSFVELAPPGAQFQSVMDRLFMTRHIDLVQYEFPQMARFRPLRPCPTILDNHNVEHELLARVARSAESMPQRMFNNAEWRKVRRLERQAWAGVTLNIATSARDAERIQADTGAAVPVVPNGVDLSAYRDIQPSERVPGRVVFVGAMRHQPNAGGARWYAEHVHPLVVEAVPGATFEIVGADPPSDVAALESDSVTVTGRVDSVIPHLERASVAVVPLAAGGGTRLKLLEAFAAGVPVVSTSVGAEGLDVQRDRDLLIADTPRDFADAVIRVVRGADLPPGYSTSNGQRLVQSHYDWESAVVPALVAAHERAIERFKQSQRVSM